MWSIFLPEPNIKGCDGKRDISAILEREHHRNWTLIGKIPNSVFFSKSEFVPLFQEHSLNYSLLTFSFRGSCLSFQIWDKNTLECVKVLTGHTGSVLCLQYDENVTVTGSSDSTVRYSYLANAGCLLLLHLFFVVR